MYTSYVIIYVCQQQGQPRAAANVLHFTPCSDISPKHLRPHCKGLNPLFNANYVAKFCVIAVLRLAMGALGSKSAPPAQRWYQQLRFLKLKICTAIQTVNASRYF